MILTVTMNPSVDISYPLEEFNLDTVNRVAKVSKTPGGKGLNVTRVLKQLDDEVVATGLIGGALGTDIQKKLSKKGIKNDFFEIAGKYFSHHCYDCNWIYFEKKTLVSSYI